MLGTNRIRTTIFLALVCFIFAIGVESDLPWQIGWLAYFLVIVNELIASVRSINRHEYQFDILFFSLGMLTFTIIDPIFAIVAGAGFPGVDDREYQGSFIGNHSGFVLTLFCLCFCLGRLVVGQNPKLKFAKTERFQRLQVVRTPILVLAFLLSLLPYFANGDGLSFQNFIGSLNARAGGYLAFSTAGLGNQNPFVTLMAQSIPTAIILWLLSIHERRWAWRIMALLVSIFLLALFASLGGRSGVVMVFVCISIYTIVRFQMPIKLINVALLAIVVSSILAFQINFRDKGNLLEVSLDRSPFQGFSLNREVAFIVENYGEGLDFIRGATFNRALSPLPDTIIKFVVNPIPRLIWQSKPLDPSFGPHNFLRTGRTGFERGSNITPTAPGRYYILYGNWGVIQIGFIFGILWAFANRLVLSSGQLNPTLLLVGAMWNSIMFISIRDFTPGLFYSLGFLLMFIYISRLMLASSVRGNASSVRGK
jgi:oligosaccharide repeat unit polymerase